MNRFIHYILLTIFLTSCLGTTGNGDQVANCPADYSFNTIQRKCVFSGGSNPEGTLGLIESNEDEQTLLAVTYNRVDGKQANRCIVRSEDQDVEYVSPLIDGVVDRGDDVADEARAAWQSIPSSPSFAVQKANAELASQNADAAQAQLEIASETLVVIAALESLIHNARVAGEAAESIVENSDTFVQGRITLAEVEELEKIKQSVEDRCECQNGSCKTLSRPRKNFFGDSEFRYQIIDQIGRVSPVKEVINRVKSVNDLPVAASFTVSLDEANDPDAVLPPLYNFTIPLAKDVEDNLNSSGFHYEITKAPVNGTLSHCMGVGLDTYVASGADVLNPPESYTPSYQDRTCKYRPYSSDMTAEGVKSSFTFNGINFVAAAPGEWGDNIKIEFVHVVGSANDPQVKVDGRIITIEIEQGITTALDVFAALINDQFASTLLDFETNVDLLATSLTSANFNVLARTEYLQDGYEPMDTIEYRVYDGTSYSLHSAVVGIKVQPESDPPRILIGNMTSPTIVITENELVDTNLSFITDDEDASIDDDITGVMIVWEDAEGDMLNSCEVTIEDDNFHILRECECVDTDPISLEDKPVCSFLVKPFINKVGTFTNSIKMKITSVDGLTSEEFLPVTVTEIHDNPVPAMINTENLIESDTAAPLTYTINVPAAFDIDPTSPVSYTIVDLPGKGTLANCMGLNSSANNDLECEYTPESGNLTRIGRKANRKIQSLRFTAKFSGSYAENISFEIINVDFLAPGKVIVENDGLDFTIKLRTGTVAASTLRSILEDTTRSPYLSKLVDITYAGPESANMEAETRLNLIGGVDGADFFTYSVTDGSTAGIANGYVNIDIFPENDVATICQYSKFSEAPECGIKGCIGEDTPMTASITPSATGLKYYQQELAVCYVSNGTDSPNNWEVVTDTTQLISDQEINEKDVLVIDEIRIDEGGGSATSDACTLNMPDVCITNGDVNNVERECRGDGDPTGVIRVESEDAADQILYFDQLNTFCYVWNKSLDQWEDGDEFLNSTVDEDRQTVIIDSLSSSNSNLIPIENITFEWKHEDSTKVITHRQDPPIDPGPPWVFGRTNISDDKYPLRIYIQPQLGQIQDATSESSTISFQVYDRDLVAGDGPPITVSFDVTVHAVAAIHNGWNKILAFGPKVNKHNVVLGSQKVCNFHLDMCNSGTACQGAGDPVTLGFIPDDTSAIYYDTNNEKCYYASQPGSASNWIEFSSHCSVSHSRDRSECGGTSVACIKTENPNGVVTSTGINTFYYDRDSEKCYRSTKANSNSDWEEYLAPGEVTIGWENFNIVGQASITGFNIYRRLAGEEFDYDLPINKELLTVNTNEYVDNAENSTYPPIPGTTYYYEVRPLVNNILTGTNEIFNVVRVLTPPNNMALVHRWMANLTMCETLNKKGIPVTDGGIDARNNYRCQYAGPGNTDIAGTGFYDFGKDLLVDRYEVGCNYSPSPACNGTFDNSCIGDEEPTLSGVTAEDDAIYYNRGNGKCYVRKNFAWNEVGFRCEFSSNCGGGAANCVGDGHPTTADGGGPLATAANGSFYYDRVGDKCYISTDFATNTWREVLGNSSSINLNLLMANANSAQNPPMVFVTQKEAASMCFHSPTVTGLVGVTQNRLERQLPTRKEHLIFSQWNQEDLTATTIATMETGLSINSSSKCNSSSASGLESFFSDSPKPSSSVLYTLPGTNTSQIRSLMTGSNGKNLNTFGTELCQSKFGIQDAIGNVSEWVVERMKCTTPTNCQGVSTSHSSDVALIDADSGFTWKEITTGVCSSATNDCDLVSPYDTFSQTCTGGVEWNLIDSAQCSILSNSCDTDSDGVFTDTCTGAGVPAADLTKFDGMIYLDTAAASGSNCYESNIIHPLDVMVNKVGAIYTDTASGKCYESVLAFRGTNDDFTVEGFDSLNDDYELFALGGTPLESDTGSKYYLGPCKDTNADDICDGFLDGWRFEEEKYDAGAMFVPMGLPVHRDFNFFSTGDQVADFIAEIGPSSGITSANLHDDAFYLNTNVMFADHTFCGAMAVGGGFLDGGDSGTYFFDILPCSGKSSEDITSASNPNNELNEDRAFAVIGDLSFRAKSDSAVDAISIKFISPGTYCAPVQSRCDFGAGSTVSCSGTGEPGTDVTDVDQAGKVNGSHLYYLQSDAGETTCWRYPIDGAAYNAANWVEHTVLIDVGINETVETPANSDAAAIASVPSTGLIEVQLGMDSSGVVQSTASAIAAAINTEKATAASKDFFDVVVSGSGSNDQNSFDDNIVLDEELDENNRVDVGFRCVIPVTDYAIDSSD